MKHKDHHALVFNATDEAVVFHAIPPEAGQIAAQRFAEASGVLRDGNAFPMRVVSHGTDGGETMRMEVTKVDKSPVPASLFSTEGYSEFSIPGMGGGGFNLFKNN